VKLPWWLAARAAATAPPCETLETEMPAVSPAIRGETARHYHELGRRGTVAGTVVDPITRRVRPATLMPNGSIEYRVMGHNRTADRRTASTWKEN
jgi:hypothetical protein